MLALLLGLEMGGVKTARFQGGDVFGGSQGSKKVTEGRSSERRWKDIVGMLFTEEEFRRQKESVRSWRALRVQSHVEFKAPGKRGFLVDLNFKQRLQ